MDGFNFGSFLNTFDFAALMRFFQDGEYMQLLHNPIVLGIGGLLLLLIAVPKTREFGTMLVGYGAIGLVYGVGGIVLKNSVISQPGPFILMAILAFGAVGWFIWNNILN